MVKIPNHCLKNGGSASWKGAWRASGKFQERPQPGAEIGEVFQFTQGPGSFGVCRQAWVGLVVEPGLAVDGFAPQGGLPVR